MVWTKGTTLLGKTTNSKPGLKTERAYKQTHGASSIMGKHAENMLENMAKTMDAELDQTIYIPVSRNPGGVHSDQNRGENMREDYRMR